MKTLVIGLGNPMLTDDGVGLQIADQLQTALDGRSDIVLDRNYHGGLRLMECMVGYQRAVVVDAVLSSAPPGSVHVLLPDALPTQHSASAHDVNLPTALAFGRLAGLDLPANEEVWLVGVEAGDVTLISESLTAEVAAAIPLAVEIVLALLETPPTGA